MDTLPGLNDWYHHTMEDKSDPRSAPWLMMSSPWPMLSIVVGYLLFVKVAPLYMATRKPFELQKSMIVYNFLLVLLSLYMLHEFLITSFLNSRFSKICQVMDYSDDPVSMRLAGAVWWYFFSKIIELLDTVIFILRKKNNQISFLHVYHHSTMVVLWWFGAKFVPGGESYFSITLNSFIHVLMYTYYMLSACGPSMQKYIWWKRYMTKLQLLQFGLVLIHTAHAAYVNCGFPRVYLYLLIAYMISHIILFANFYHKSYIVKRSDNNKNDHHGNGVVVGGHHRNGVAVNGCNGNSNNVITNGFGTKTEKTQ